MYLDKTRMKWLGLQENESVVDEILKDRQI